MNKIFLLLIILCSFTHFVKAQKTNLSSDSISGLVVYTAIVEMETPGIVVDTLTFNRRKSIFVWNENQDEENSKLLEKAKSKYPNATSIKSFKNKDLKKNIRDINLFKAFKDSIYSRKHMIGQIYLIKAKKPNIQWNISDSTKKLGGYTVIKATTCFRGRNYIAWFTPEIPVPYGPWKLIGLPGLILQAYNPEKSIYFSAKKIKINNTGKIGSIPPNTIERIVNLEEYKTIMSNKRYRTKKHALKVGRQFTRKNSEAKIKVIMPQTETMEIFDKDKKKCQEK